MHTARSVLRTAAALPLLAVLLQGQGTQPAPNRPLSARDLYYEKAYKDDNSASADAAKKVVPVTHYLGLRYTLLKVDPESKAVQAVDADGNFKEGDCFAVELAPNRGGYLYVFNEGSSGEWQLLMPSPAMPEEADFVKPSVPARLPQEYCFRVDNHPGVETLVIAVTESRQDVDRLHLNLGKPNLRKPQDPAAADTTAVVNTTDARAEIENWQNMSGRDLKFEKADEPAAQPLAKIDERPHSVYVVNTSNAASGRLVIKIKIRHL